jgi:periplasmic nitrate reductase NapD
MDKAIERRAFLGLTSASPGRAAECHISSVLVHVRPELQDQTATYIDELRGVETQQPRTAGKLIATIETASTMEIVDRIEEIQRLPGVIAVTLVFHQWEAGAVASGAGSEDDHGSHASQLSQG